MTSFAAGLGRVRELPLHPFIAAALVPLNPVAAHPDLFVPSDAVRPLAILAGLCALLLFALGRLLPAPGGAIVMSACFIGCLLPWAGKSALAIHAAVVLGLVVLLRRHPAPPPATTAMNVALAAMLLVPLWSMGKDAWTGPGEDAPPPGPFQRSGPIQSSGPLPSIVHIVLDGYGGAESLRSVMGFDNSEFFDALATLGFVVAPNARSPYNQTLFTMSSIFYGDYIPAGRPPLSEDVPARVRRSLSRLVTNGPVQHQLRASGYHLAFTESGYSAIRFPRRSTVYRPAALPNPLELHMMAVYPLGSALSGLRWLTGGTHHAVTTQRRVTAHALTTEAYRTLETPLFLYHHIMAPHPPFDVDEHGRPTDRWLQAFGQVGLADGDHVTLGHLDRQMEYREGYVAKLKYVNAAVLRQVSSMIQTIPSPKVILLHGDHGSGSRLHFEDPSRTCLAERFSTFLAVYSDDAAVREAFARATAGRPNVINVYRVLFDARFGTSLGPLEDRSYFVRWSTPWEPERLAEAAMTAACGDMRDR